MESFLFPELDDSTPLILDRLLLAIDDVFPLPGRFRATLARDVADLSRLLTSERSQRNDGYLGQAAHLSAYVRYFLPWNVYRLVRLLGSLPLQFQDQDFLTDVGSGPLTFPLALWIARPDLRQKRLTFRCLDRTGKILDAGKRIFTALTQGSGDNWTIVTIRGSLGESIRGEGAALVTAINLFNELFWDSRIPLRSFAEKNGGLLRSLASPSGSILVVEPGIPRSGAFISELRNALLGEGRFPLAPCPHGGPCPLSGGSRGSKWCHFVFETDSAPAPLKKLSAAAGIPKERATLSFLFAQPKTSESKAVESAASLRIISDPFPLDRGLYGRYACAEWGLTLVTGSKRAMEASPSGLLLSVPKDLSGPSFIRDGARDKKSGALIIDRNLLG